MIAWAATVGLLFALWLAMAWKYGPQRALGCMVLVACLVPTWVKLELTEGAWLDVRVTASILGLCAYCLHPKANFPVRLGVLDVVMLGLLGVHFASDLDNEGFGAPQVAMVAMRAYGEWCVPYFAGRLALQRSEDLRFLAPWGMAVGLLLSMGSIIEGVTGEHPWELVYGEREYDGIARDIERWGVTRAWGCCAHPIYFGFLQLMFMPWMLRAWHRTRQQAGKTWTWIIPLVGVAGIYCTGSRSPLLGAMLLLVLGLVAFVPRLRIPVALLAIGLMGVAVWQRDKVSELVTQWGETINRANTMEVDGQEVQVSGTMSRWYLVQVYMPAMVKASWLGFGTKNVSTFPVRVPVGAVEPETLAKTPYIDNQFVLMTLRFGWIGVAAFTVALLLASISWFQRSWDGFQFGSPSSASAVSFYVGGTILAVTGGLLTVWMPHDIGFPLLWWMGAGSSSSSKPSHSPK